MTWENIQEASLNKSASDILDIHLLLTQSIRNFISRTVMNNTEENPIKLFASIDHLGQTIELDSIYSADDGSGYIFLHGYGDSGEELMELDELDTDEQIVVVLQLDKYLNG